MDEICGDDCDVFDGGGGDVGDDALVEICDDR